jgi:putative PIN family toxin of toxin-antitoxin system
MRIFLDTNVLVSSFTTRGICSDILREILIHEELVVCQPLLRELEKVLSYKFQIPKNIINNIIHFLQTDTIISETENRPEVKLNDQSDLIILSCALNGKSKYLVTGDKELQELKKVDDLIILSPRAYWEIIKK